MGMQTPVESDRKKRARVVAAVAVSKRRRRRISPTRSLGLSAFPCSSRWRADVDGRAGGSTRLRGERHADSCPGLSIRTLHAESRRRRQRQAGAFFVGPSDNRSVGLPRSHFVCSCRLGEEEVVAAASKTTCVVAVRPSLPFSLSPSPSPSLSLSLPCLPLSSFLAQNERWIAVFSRADERSTKRGQARGKWKAANANGGANWSIQEICIFLKIKMSHIC